MPDTIRLLHFADLHVGMENYGRLDPGTGLASRVRDFLDRLDEVIDYALANEADLVIFAGDAFKNRDPDPTQQREFAQRVKRLADAAPTLLLVGNHDLPGMAARATSVDIFQALGVPNVIVGHKPGSQVVQTRRGPVHLAWMPYPMRNRLLASDEHRGKSIEELDLALRETVTNIIKELAEAAEAQAMPRVFAGHFSVSEAKFGSERSVMLGRDVAILKSQLAHPAWDYIALGHIHRYQNLTASGQGEFPVEGGPEGGLPPVVYSGSLERVDFGEEREPKGFCWVELERGRTRYRFVRVQARPFLTIQADARQAEDPTEAALARVAAYQAEAAGAVVRLQVKLDAGQEAQWRDREIYKALDAAYHVTINKEIENAARVRLGGLAPETLTPTELVARYFQSRDYQLEQVGKLVEYAETIINAGPE
jgi:exonuclease SbcD